MEKQANVYRFIKLLIKLHLGDPSAYLLLVFLCHAANNKTGESWHSYASIAYTTGMTEKTIRRATKALLQLGVLSCERRNRQQSNLYTVHYDRLLALAEQGQKGRSEFIQAEQEKKSARQRRWRDGHKGVSYDPSETVTTSERDGQCTSCETVNLPLVRQSIERPNYVTELANETRDKELDGNKSSGQEAGHKDIERNIQELEKEVSVVSKLKSNAMHERRLAEYTKLTRQLQESQARLNRARGLLYQKALAAA